VSAANTGAFVPGFSFGDKAYTPPAPFAAARTARLQTVPSLLPLPLILQFFPADFSTPRWIATPL